MKSKATKHVQTEIAVVGMACRFPGSSTPTEFWNNLLQNKDLVSEIPASRWSHQEYHGKPGKDDDKTLVKWGGFIDGMDKFDNDFFKLTPKEALYMDPQQRILLEAVWETFEDAGMKPSQYSTKTIGAYIGASRHDYTELLARAEVPNDFYLSTGSSHAVLVNRINYFFNFRGPSVAVDAACASSLVAIHEAVKGLRAGECEMAIAGGVNALLTPTEYISLDKTGVLSRDGKCKVFDQTANGYVRGEGVGCILLKPLDKAIEDGDRIYGVIRGSLINHDGKTQTFTSPSQEAQSELITRCYQQIGVNSNDISYVEAHGTGTVIGDPIEFMALKEAFTNTREGKVTPKSCGLGSVKTNIGHMESAAGIGSVIKVLLAMKHEMIPATIHLKKMNPFINLEGSPFYIVTENKEWKGHRMAGVSSFGYGGANAHVLLESYEQKPVSKKSEGKNLILLSAPNKDGLSRIARKYLDFFKDGRDLDMASVAYTTQTSREEFRERLVVIAATAEEAARSLQNYLDGHEDESVILGSTQIKASMKMLFSGDESSHAFISGILAEKNFRKLGILWVGGLEVNWAELYKEKQYKTTLPTYAFAPNSFWPKVKKSASKKGEKIKLRFLEANTFEVELSGHDFFLEHHRVQGKKTLPGVFYSEIARMAGAEGLGWQGNALKNLTILSPVQVTTNTKLTIKFADDLSFSIQEHGTERATGKLLKEKQLPGLSTYAQFESFASANKVSADPEKFYQLMFDRGLDYGTTFQGVREVYSSSSETWTKLALNDSWLATLDDYTLHPTFLDGALQGSGPISTDKQDTMVPVSFGEIRRHGKMEAKLLSHCRLIKKSANSVTLDFSLYNERGELVLELLNVGLFAFNRTAAPVAASVQSASRKIAVIGMSCKIAGANDPQSFWELLRAGKETFVEVPKERWDTSRFFDASKTRKDSSYTKWASLVDDYDCFDYQYFGFSKDEAITLDPQQRVILECTQHLFDDAGFTRKEISGKKCSFYLATGEERYNKINLNSFNQEQMKYFITSSIENLVAARVPDYFNLKGPCLTIDTACSSSLVAIDLAIDSILHGGCELAIAGGVELIQDHFSTVGFAQMGVLSKEPHHYAFDKRSQGFVMGEGAGLVLLKDYDQAVRDGDNIQGVILATAINNDGKTVGIAAPGIDGQKEVIEMALKKAGIGADTISYMEAHGTGTMIGDPIEVRALSLVYQNYGSETQYCALGTVKPNIGHLLRAAGIASFIKTVMALKTKRIPKLISCEQPNTSLKLETTPFFLNTDDRPWSPRKGVRRAAISSFGFGGTNAHTILEEFTPPAGYVQRRTSLPLTQFKKTKLRLGQTSIELPTTSRPATITSSALSPSGTLLDLIHELVASELGFKKSDFSLTQPFMEMGLESVKLMGLARIFEERFGIELYPTIFFEYPNLEDFISYLEKEHGEKLKGMVKAAPASGTEKSAEVPAPTDLSDGIHELVSSELGFKKSDFSLTQPFMEMGLESVKLMGLARIFEERFGIELYPTIFFEYPNLQDFITYLENEHGAKLAGKFKAAPSPVASPAAAPVTPVTIAVAGPKSLSSAIHEMVATELGFNKSDFSLTQPFMEMGLESVKLMGLARIFEERFGIELYPTIFFEYPNLEEFIAYLEKEHGEKLKFSSTSASANPETEKVSVAVSSVSDSIHELVASELGFKKSDFSLTQPFMEMGLESVKLMGLARIFEERYGIELYPTIFFEYPNLQDFISYLEQEHGDKLKGKLSASTSSGASNDARLLRLLSVLNEVDREARDEGREAFLAVIDSYVAYFKQHCDVDITTITRPTHFSELGLDSLALIGLKLNMAKAKGSTVSMTELQGLETFADFAYHDARVAGLDANFLNAPEFDFLRNITIGSSMHELDGQQKYEAVIKGFDKNCLRVLEGIEFLVIGEGEPLVLLTSVNTLGTAMFNQINEFSSQFKVIVPNYPGLGKSRRQEVDLDKIAAQLSQGLTQLIGSDPFTVVGWSLGGMLAQKLARAHGTQVKALVLVNSSMVERSFSDELGDNMQLLWQMIGDFMKAQARYKEIKDLKEVFRGTKDLKLMVEYFRNANNFKGTTKSDLPDCPIVMICGERDYFFPVEREYALVNQIQNAMIVVIPGAEHLAPLTHPEALNKILRDIIERTSKTESLKIWQDTKNTPSA